MKKHEFNVIDFGAAGDGSRDDTGSLQEAIRAAAEVRGCVFFPPGVYLSSTLHLPPGIVLRAYPAWKFRENGTAILALGDESAECLLDITGARGVTIHGLCLDGRHLGDNVHGILLNKKTYGDEEDSFRVDCCRISNFTGDGLRAVRGWCFSVRHSMIGYNNGCGVWLKGWDVFMHDNWLSCNHVAGFGGFEENSAVTFTANRVEWNRKYGILLRGGKNYNITGNYVDRCGGVGVALLKRGERSCTGVAMTGNVIYRSGKWEQEEYENSHVFIDGAIGLTFTGNTLTAGVDEGGKGGDPSPRFGIVYRNLQYCVITNNTLVEGAVCELLVEMEGECTETVVRDNPGTLALPREAD